jgi:phosphoglycerate dehydrogenase-like enzyme
MWIFRRPPYRELFGRTIGVVGLGHIGRRVLKLARAYDMRLIAVSRTRPTPQDASSLGLAWAGDQAQLRQLMAEVDFVIVTTPQLPSTIGLIGEREIALMKPDAYIINPARGPIIDETALYNALKLRRIAGAAIDVWWQYPDGPDDHETRPSRFPFHELDNVLMTPHISGGTDGTSSRRSRVVAENINRLYRGEPLLNVVEELSRA